jgi:hypothetical protein
MTTTDHPFTSASLAALLTVTRITHARMRLALHDHFVLGQPQSTVAARYGFTRQQFGAQVRHLRKEVKPAFDAYAAAVLRVSA